MSLKKIYLLKQPHLTGSKGIGMGVGFLIFFLQISWSTPLEAQGDLSASTLFTRCYSQITQRLPEANHASLAAVNSGTLDPIDGCLSVLRKALFTAQNGEKIADTSNPESMSVLETFHNLHASWFYTKSFPVIRQDPTPSLIKDLLDETQPALYITRALFSPDVRADSILKLNYSLRPIRTNQAPTLGAFSNTAPGTLGFTLPAPLAATGTLLGVTRSPSSVIPVFRGTVGSDIARHFGGGFLGDQAYLRLNLGEPRGFAADGAEKMPRQWSRAVFHDVLCRDIPVVRVSDAQKFVASSSDVPFRTSAGCNVCHASADRLAMTIRGIKYFDNPGADGIIFSNPTGNPLFYTETGTNLVLPPWPSVATANFDTMRPAGVLYLRDLKGSLIQVPLGDPTSTTLTVNDSLTALGNELSKLDDFYVCLAKRYYQYFTGVEVELADPASPDEPRTLSSQDQYHLNKVTTLGQDLKTSQNLMNLIEQIVRSIDYRKSHYGQ